MMKGEINLDALFMLLPNAGRDAKESRAEERLSHFNSTIMKSNQ
jgi:hypothetical protein